MSKGHSFSYILEELKVGRKAARTGWNGKGMYVYLETFPGYDPCLVMRTVQGTLQPGWLASQSDILAEDWEVVD